jgi:hypothetical protein
MKLYRICNRYKICEHFNPTIHVGSPYCCMVSGVTSFNDPSLYILNSGNFNPYRFGCSINGGFILMYLYPELIYKMVIKLYPLKNKA